MILRRVGPDYPHWPAVLRLIRAEFAHMDGRIDPPSSMHRLTVADMAENARTGAVLVVEDAGAPVACVFCAPKGDALYLGKLAVSAAHRESGLARALVAAAEAEALATGVAALELQTRIELAENHAAFARLGFATTGETAHPGFDRPTSITMRKAIGPAPIRARRDYPRWDAVLRLIRTAFAYMDARLGAPSPAHALTAARLAEGAAGGAVFLYEEAGAPVACLFTRPSLDFPDALYLGRLAVAEAARGRGLARRLIAAAEGEARRLGFAGLTLDTGAPLTELRATFARLGFREVGETGGVVAMRRDL